MLRCKELSRLPKAASRKSVNFRRQTPGSVTEHFKVGNKVSSNCLDPSHPAIHIPKSHFPNIRSNVLGVKAVPFATLAKPEQVWTTPCNPPIDVWTERIKRLISTNSNLGAGEEPLEVAPILLHNAREDAIPMSFMNATSKKRTSNKRHIRVKIVSRLKIAINLIVSRGADVAEVNGKPKLVMNEEEVQKMSDKWVSPGWTYIFFPTLEIYRMPYHDLIPLLRKSLRRVYDLSQQYEEKWVSVATEPRKVLQSHKPSHVQALHQHVRQTTFRKPFTNGNPKQIGYRAYSTRIDHTTQPGSAKGKFNATPREHDSHASKKTIQSHDKFQSSVHLPHSGLSHKLDKAPTNPTPRERNSLVSRKIIQSHDEDQSSERPPYVRRSNQFDEASTLVPRLKNIVVQTSGSSPTAESEVTSTICLGDVGFPVSVSRDDPPKIIPAIRKDDPNIIMLEELRNDAKKLLNQSSKLCASKRKRDFIRRRIAARQAGQRKTPELEFIGFDSRPNPSYDPFTGVEASSRLQEGLTPTRKETLDHMKTRSARTSPGHSGWSPVPEATDPALPGFPSEYPRAEPLSLPPDDFDPFAPLISMEEKQHELTIHTELVDKSPSDSSDPLDVDPFAPLEPTSTFSAPELKPEVELTSPTISSAKTPSVEDLVLKFDPFHAEDSDSCINATTTTPVSPPTSTFSPPPYTSTTEEWSVEDIRASFAAARTSRSKSAQAKAF